MKSLAVLRICTLISGIISQIRNSRYKWPEDKASAFHSREAILNGMSVRVSNEVWLRSQKWSVKEPENPSPKN